MPIDNALSTEVWQRYQWLRDNGHRDFIDKARKCEDFFAGMQWDPTDLAALRAQRRPALTINKILSTVSNVLGEQIFNRVETVFKPRNGDATREVANALTKVYMQISDNNQLPWVRSDVFCDGVVTGRGFYDVRLDFTDSLQGEVRITQLNPKQVMIDCDADAYDPDSWGDVIVTRWLTTDQIELLYSKADADRLRMSDGSIGTTSYSASSDDFDRDRFGTNRVVYPGVYGDETLRVSRNVRILERQHKKLHKTLHFVDMATGDMRIVPEELVKNPEQLDAYLQANPNLYTMKKVIERIRWTVVADNLVLHDDWSPYQHFTVVPFFPYFQRGRAIGLVENLLGSQELLNKVSSQELHVVNTSANSGWKVKKGALQNMSTGELEQRGATTGLVLELDDVNNAEKITPNATPQGLDRISFKAEDHIKTISGVSDYAQGFAREDVAAKSVVANQQAGQANLAKVNDNLRRTDWLLARAVLDCVQEFYTEQRLVYITTDRYTQDVDSITVNEATPEGRIVNDLTLGEYAIVITSQPERDTFEDTQFEQAVRLRTEVGVAIPDTVLIKASTLADKAEILTALEGDKDSPEAKRQAELAARAQEAEVASKEAEAQSKGADAQLKSAKTQSESVKAAKEAATPPEVSLDPREELALERERMTLELQMERERMQEEMRMEREKHQQQMAMDMKKMMQDMFIEREKAQQQARLEKIKAVQSSFAANKGSKPGSGGNAKPKK